MPQNGDSIHEKEARSNCRLLLHITYIDIAAILAWNCFRLKHLSVLKQNTIYAMAEEKNKRPSLNPLGRKMCLSRNTPACRNQRINGEPLRIKSFDFIITVLPLTIFRGHTLHRFPDKLQIKASAKQQKTIRRNSASAVILDNKAFPAKCAEATLPCRKNGKMIYRRNDFKSFCRRMISAISFWNLILPPG